MFYALDPRLLQGFVTQVEKASESLADWAPIHRFLVTLCRPPRVRFMPSGPWPIAALEDLGRPLSPNVLPDADQKAALFRSFAMWFAPCQFLPNEPKLYLQADLLTGDHPELRLDTSEEWRLLAERLFAPDYLPDAFPFLAADPDNSSASCLTSEDVRELLAAEQRERLLERQVIGFGTDALAILGLLQLAASQGWYIWYHEVS